MKLDELLDELRTNLLTDDADLASGPDDRLWSDETLVRYLNDAQRQFAKKSLCIRDNATPEVVQVQLITGQSQYTLHTSVRAVISARYNTDSFDLTRVGHALLSDQRPTDTPYFDANVVSTLTPGAPRAFTTDESFDLDEDTAVLLTLFPAPSADEDGLLVNLRVARMPLRAFDLDNTEAKAELPSDYQLDMLEWVAWRCKRTSDIDGYSEQAEKHRKRFDEAVDEALTDARRKLFVPVRWGFGRGGFTW